MTEYIEREAAVQALLRERKTYRYTQEICAVANCALVIEKDVQSADVAEVRHGRWVFNRHQAPNEKLYFCSLCAEGESDNGRDKYCPNCGAKMDGKGEGE